MWRKTRIAVLALALVLALAPGAPRAQTAQPQVTKVQKGVAYASCIGSVILMPLTVVGVFAMAAACAHALAISNE